MEKIWLVLEKYTNGYVSNISGILFVFAIFLAVIVIIWGNPVLIALFLIGLYGTFSLYSSYMGKSTNVYESDILIILFLYTWFFPVIVFIYENPLVSALLFIVLFGTVSLYLIEMGFVFIDLELYVIFIGVISWLFLFILMLIMMEI